MTVVKVHVLYCGGWGYKKHAVNLQNVLKEEFNDEVSVEIEADKAVSGAFEVTVQDKLVHSKKAGKGRCETATEQQVVIDHIQEILDEAWWSHFLRT